MWKSGWLEQGGVQDGALSTTATFLKPYANTDYIVMVNAQLSSGGTYNATSLGYRYKKTTSVEINQHPYDGHYVCNGKSWYTAGKAAETVATSNTNNILSLIPQIKF